MGYEDPHLRRHLEKAGPHTFWGFLVLQTRYGTPPWWANSDRWLKLDEAKRRERLFYRGLTKVLMSIMPQAHEQEGE